MRDFKYSAEKINKMIEESGHGEKYMKYRVINRKTKEDITDKYCWVVRPDGKLYVNEYGDLIGYPDAMYLPESAADKLM